MFANKAKGKGSFYLPEEYTSLFEEDFSKNLSASIPDEKHSGNWLEELDEVEATLHETPVTDIETQKPLKGEESAPITESKEEVPALKAEERASFTARTGKKKSKTSQAPHEQQKGLFKKWIPGSSWSFSKEVEAFIGEVREIEAFNYAVALNANECSASILRKKGEEEPMDPDARVKLVVSLPTQGNFTDEKAFYMAYAHTKCEGLYEAFVAAEHNWTFIKHQLDSGISNNLTIACEAAAPDQQAFFLALKLMGIKVLDIHDQRNEGSAYNPVLGKVILEKDYPHMITLNINAFRALYKRVQGVCRQVADSQGEIPDDISVKVQEEAATGRPILQLNAPSEIRAKILKKKCDGPVMEEMTTLTPSWVKNNQVRWTLSDSFKAQYPEMEKAENASLQRA